MQDSRLAHFYTLAVLSMVICTGNIRSWCLARPLSGEENRESRSTFDEAL